MFTQKNNPVVATVNRSNLYVVFLIGFQRMVIVSSYTIIFFISHFIGEKRFLRKIVTTISHKQALCLQRLKGRKILQNVSKQNIYSTSFIRRYTLFDYPYSCNL